MGGLFGVVSKEDCVMDVYFERITIHTREPAEEEWQSGEAA